MSHVSILRPRNLAWLPAALLVSAGILSAFGVSLTPNGRAATATGTTTISATVLPEVSLDLGQTTDGVTSSAAACSAGAGTISGTANNETAEFGTATSRLAINASGATDFGTCNMTFGTNNGSNGASLSYKSARITTAARTFCTAAVASDCGAGNTYYTDDDGANNVLEADKFGVRLDSRRCDNTAVPMTVGNYYGAPLSTATAQDICTGETASSSVLNDGAVAVSFHVNTSTIASGNYNAQLVFTATAN